VTRDLPANGVLLHPAAHLVQRVEPEPDDVEVPGPASGLRPEAVSSTRSPRFIKKSRFGRRALDDRRRLALSGSSQVNRRGAEEALRQRADPVAASRLI